jgi:signal transduction histidine kinase
MIHLEFARDLDHRIDAELVDRARSLQALETRGSTPGQLLALSGEALAQIYAPDGRVLASTRRLQGSRLMAAAQVRAVSRRPMFVAGRIAHDDDGVRVRGVLLPGSGRVAAIGEYRRERERSLHRLALLLAIALPGALLLASLVGYLVAGAALRPVERMRARAAAIGDSDRHERLPAPGTRDELDRLATTLNDLLDRMQLALERERRIVSDASHELRTPIAVLRTRLEVALRGAGDDPEQLRAALAAALGDGERLSRLADTLLVLARFDQDGLPLSREPLDLQDLLEEAADRHRVAVTAAGRELEVHVDVDGGAVVDADADRVAQALDNLVVNALRYGEGTIELRGMAAPDGIAFVVSDGGPGFPPDFLPRAFERFSQADASHGSTGSGLGLALVDAIARAHGGRAAVANRDGGGASATLVLPTA